MKRIFVTNLESVCVNLVPELACVMKIEMRIYTMHILIVLLVTVVTSFYSKLTSFVLYPTVS